jgi:hypothetical protein
MTCFNLTGEEEKMGKKIVGVFLCMLLIGPVVQAIKLKENISPQTLVQDEIPCIDIGVMKGKIGKFIAEIKNIGNMESSDVNWSIDISGGLILSERSTMGTIPPLLPDNSEGVFIKVFGFGIVDVKISCSYVINKTIKDPQKFYINLSKFYKTLVVGPLVISGDLIQKFFNNYYKWFDITNYKYDYDTEQNIKFVRLYYNVPDGNYQTRCVDVNGGIIWPIQTTIFGFPMYAPGEGFVWEGWLTQDLVKQGLAHWEIWVVP